jgi:hypothetical protein
MTTEAIAARLIEDCEARYARPLRADTMSEPTKVVVEVNNGVVCNVYGPNVEYVVVDWDDIRRGGAKPNKNQFWPARPHV